MGRNSNKVPICFPPVMEFFNYPPMVRLEILTTFSLSNMIEYLTRVLHPSNRFSAQVTQGLQPPEEAINNLGLSANEEMLDEFLNRNINFNLMCYLTAQNRRSKNIHSNSASNYSPYDDFSLVINLSSPSSSPNENQPSISREIPRLSSYSHMKGPFGSNSVPILSSASMSMTPFDDPFEFSSSISFQDEFPPHASTVSEMSWNGSESSISSSFMFVSSGDDSRPGTPANAPSNSGLPPRFSYAEMLSKGLDSADYVDSHRMNPHFPPLGRPRPYKGSTSGNNRTFMSPPSSLNLPSWSPLEKPDKRFIEFKVSKLPLWKKYREQGIPDRDNYYELLKIWYSYPRINETARNWFFDVWNENILQEEISTFWQKQCLFQPKPYQKAWSTGVQDQVWGDIPVRTISDFEDDRMFGVGQTLPTDSTSGTVRRTQSLPVIQHPPPINTSSCNPVLRSHSENSIPKTELSIEFQMKLTTRKT